MIFYRKKLKITIFKTWGNPSPATRCSSTCLILGIWNISYMEHSQTCLLVPDVLWWGSSFGKKKNSWKSSSLVLMPLTATCRGKETVVWIPRGPGKDVFADWLSAGGTDVKRRPDRGEQDEKKATFLYNFWMAWGLQVIKRYIFSQGCDSMRSCLHLNTDQCCFCAPAHCHLSHALGMHVRSHWSCLLMLLFHIF